MEETNDGTKNYPYSWSYYQKRKELGEWNGGWVIDQYSVLSYITRSGIIHREPYIGSASNPFSSEAYNEMFSRGIWEGGYVQIAGLLTYRDVNGNTSESGTGGNNSSSGCGCGCGCGSSSGSDSYMVSPGSIFVNVSSLDTFPSCLASILIKWTEGVAMNLGSGSGANANGFVSEISAEPGSYVNESLYGDRMIAHLGWDGNYKIHGTVEYLKKTKANSSETKTITVDIDHDVPDIYKESSNTSGCS